MIANLIAAAAWVLIFATDGKVAPAAEIHRHEMGHVVCPSWHHPKGMDPKTGKAYVPPTKCRGRPAVEVIEVPVTTQEAIERCNGAFGRENDRSMIGCAFQIK